MDPLTIGFALAKFAPDLIKWFTGSDKAADVATKAIDLAKTVTGQPDGDSALKAIEADPALAEKYQEAVLANNLEFAKLAVQNAADINKTIQVEVGAEHWPSYSWRPFIGFVFGSYVLSLWLLPLFGKAPVPISSDVVLTVGAILGVASWFRGKAQADPNHSAPVKG